MILSRYYGFNFTTNPADYGLALMWSMNTTNIINITAMTCGMLSKALTSVQRIEELAGNTVFEASFNDPEPPKNWPTNGRISGSKVSVRYRPGLPLVLKGLDFTVESGEKAAIIGRTGSGKSTMILCLVRIMEMAENEETQLPLGQLYIDGVDIATVGLHHLRRAVTIIPQDPIMFEGSLTFNVDPFSQYSSNEIANA